MKTDSKSNLQVFLYKHGISYQVLADEAVVSRQTIYNAIAGKCTENTVKSLSEALERVCRWRGIEYVDPFSNEACAALGTAEGE